MTDYKTPTRDQHARFLIGFLFRGEMEPGLSECVERAYLDLSRTLHGVNESTDSKATKDSARELVESILANATSALRGWPQVAFDDWHRQSCEEVCTHYRRGGYKKFYVGQAQKWINMAMKYALTLAPLGMLEVPAAQSLRSVAHVPLDNYMMDAFRRFGPPNLGTAWSRIVDYEQYFLYQQWIRTHFRGSSPLDVEFHLWNDENKHRRAVSV